MPVWIVLLRGINVGGSHVVPMKDLRVLLEKTGFSGVRTYIQSGNVVLGSAIADAETVSGMVASAIEGKFGFRPSVFTLSPEALEAAIEANPFPADAGKALHLMFLASETEPVDLDSLRAILPDNEQVKLRSNVLYVHTPDGFGKSVVGAKIGRFVKADMTARNLNSVLRIAEMARASA